jgi:Cu(I)/Ag(I) efflux system membrane fusion protein
MLTDAQRTTLTEFVVVADAMAAALAADDLARFNAASEPAMKVAGALVEALAGTAGQLDALDQARHLHGFADIKSARVAFHRFSVAAAAALGPLRKSGNAPPFELYECGMVDEAIPGVPKKARWIQSGGRPLANPFFGAEMIECGKAIKP